jgi:hypothetical protein
MIDVAANVTATGWVDNRGFMCVDPNYSVEQACQAFRSIHGTHRASPWFKLAPTLRLCTIEEAREKMRAWAEAAWETLGINQGRGVMDAERGFVATPVPNPYSQAPVSA